MGLQSLVRDPRFVASFGHEEWFPPVPATSQDVLASFRRFVRILPTRPHGWHDPHWSPQVELIGAPEIDYHHVGGIERLDETMAVLGDYVSALGRSIPPAGRENPSLVPYASGLLDGPALEACSLFTASDREAFGYEPVVSVDSPDESWHAHVEANIPAIVAIIERHERIGDLRRMLKDMGKAPSRAPSRLDRVRSASAGALLHLGRRTACSS